MIEAGAACVKDRVWKQQKNFLMKKLQDVDEPLTKVFRLCQRENTKGYRYLQRVMDSNDKGLEEIRTTIRTNNTSTKRNTYKLLNPELVPSPVYQDETNYIPDYVRVEYTRFRTGSHLLNIEKGRWSRIPAEEQCCTCDNQSIQNELLALLINRNVTSKISDQPGDTIRRNTWKETCFLHLRSNEDIQMSLHEILYIF